jgi:hypothetical protein
MMVFDASALILLAKIDLLDLFILNYGGQVLMPLKVKEEVLQKDGFAISKMLDMVKEHGVAANLEEENYRKGLKTIRKVWQ